MLKTTKVMIMKKAWSVAKQGAEKFGGTSKEYFSAALKYVWAQYKTMRKAKGGHIASINPSFLYANYEKAAAAHIQAATYKVVKQTEKALLVAIPVGEGTNDVNEIWFPKSVCI